MGGLPELKLVKVSLTDGSGGRILDILGDAACQVEADGWPQAAEPPPLGFLPVCN